MLKRKAFTLIEIIVIIVVVGILAGMITIGLQGARVKARDAQRKSDLHDLKVAIILSYPDDITSVKVKGTYTISTDATLVSGLSWLVSGHYIDVLPSDPKGTNQYEYMTSATGSDFAVFASLENSRDGDIKTDNPTAGVTPSSYNYWVQNDK